MNMSSEPNIEPSRQIRSFIADVAPIFRGRHVVIADVGAHIGATFAAFQQSSLKIDRAYLFEANPRSFERLEETVAALGATDRTTCHQIALSDKAGKLSLHDMNDMSHVVGAAPETPEAAERHVFEVEAKPLDDYRTLFPDGRISILKINVQGHETQVLKGAAGILSDHAADVVYVEAGVDRDNPHFTYYRDIEDLLAEHGYRLFKIYEQTMEWIDDRALLRRMHLAFISPAVADKYPYSLLRELSRQDAEMARLQNDLAARNEQLAALGAERTAERERLNKALEETQAQLTKAHQELAILAHAVNEFDERQSDKSESHGELASRLVVAEQRVRDLENSTIWRLSAPLRRALDRFRG